MRLFLLFAPLFGVCFFQNHAFSQWSVGAAVGINGTFRLWEVKNNVSHRRSFDDWAPGWNVHFLAERAFSPTIALQAEGGYQVWRTREKAKLFPGPGTLLDLQLANVTKALFAWSSALSVRISPLRGKSVYLLAGHGVSYITQEIIITSLVGASKVDARRVDPKETHLKPLQFFANAGLGVRFRCGVRGRLLLEGRYQAGLSDLRSSDVTTDRISHLVAVQAGYLHQL